LSLILDALNRSRQESTGSPGLADNHFVEPPAKSTDRWQWLLITALAVAVVAIGWLLFDRLPEPAPSAQAPPPPVASTVPAAASAPERPAQPPVSPSASGKPAAAGTPPPATSPVATPPARQPVREMPQKAAVATAVRPAAKAAIPQPAPVDPGVAALYRQQVEAEASAAVQAEAVPSSPPPEPEAGGSQSAPGTIGKAEVASREEQPIDIEALVKQAQTELADARLAENGVPFLATLSQQTKDGIPTILYQRHDYSGDPARSSVVINGKSLRVGGSAGGVQVVEILPDSAVFEYRGTRFRLRALNSWVNL